MTAFPRSDTFMAGGKQLLEFGRWQSGHLWLSNHLRLENHEKCTRRKCGMRTYILAMA